MENKSVENRIIQGTMVIVIVGIVAKFASFIAEAILAAFLGTTSQSDAYYMVSSVQSVIYPMLSVGIWNVFLPLYKNHIAKKEYHLAERLTNQSLTFFSAISFAVVVLLIVFAPVVISMVAPGFEGETRALCIKLVRISAPMYVFIIASAVYASVLQCHNRFLGSQIREVASHIPTILTAFFLYRRLGVEVMALALVAASMLRLFVELPFVNWGYRFKPDVNFRRQEFTLMLKRLPSALISAGVVQLNTLVDKAMASTLPAGTVSGLNYGHKLMNVFSGLLSSAIATAMYPQMVEMISLGKKDDLAKLIVKIMGLFCVLMLPITMACVLFRIELVSVVYQRGVFTAESTVLTADVFALYCIGLFFIAANTIITNFFYGYGNTTTPMYISMANLGINVVFNLILIRFLGINGLALATSLSAMITFFIRIRLAERYMRLDNKKMIITAFKVLLASSAACWVPRTIFWLYPINRYGILLVSAILGAAIYWMLMKLLKVNEIDTLVELLRRKVKKKVS